MASLEVGEKVRNHGRYLLASEETEPGHGWNWEAALTAFATATSVVEAGKAVIDNFVKDVHPYKATGKTLSLVDLEQFAALSTQVSDVLSAFSTILESGGAADAVTAGVTRAQEYGKQGRAGERYGVDISHLARLARSHTEDPALLTKLDALIASVSAYVIHAREDGTKPNSHGVSMIAPENDSWEGNSPELIAFQDAYRAFQWGDQEAPLIVSQDDDADAADFSYLPYDVEQWGYDAAELEFWEENREGEYDYYSFSDEDWADYVAWLKAGEGTKWFGSGSEYWFSYGEVPDTPPSPARKRRRSKTETDFPFMNSLHGAFVHVEETCATPGGGRKSAEIQTRIKGISATFEDPNLADVGTVFGNRLTFDGWGDGVEDEFFLSTATLEAHPTTNKGEYFTPQWNQIWYWVQFDPDMEAEWVPLYFQRKFVHRGHRYSVFAAEIDFLEAGKDYSDPAFPRDHEGNAVEYATLEVTVNSSSVVVDYTVRPYSIVYGGPDDEEGTVVYDKASRTIDAGDRVRFYALGINLSRRGYDIWNPESDLHTFTQGPKFTFDYLWFEDEEGIPLPYDYCMKGTDASGNYVLTEFSRAQLPTEATGHYNPYDDDDYEDEEGEVTPWGNKLYFDISESDWESASAGPSYGMGHAAGRGCQGGACGK